ncbi:MULTISPECIES: 2OG-Fe(II) oxygenase [Niastella]|uniref:2OG-Fe(II) oxygenase n=1 Tax=Niastella soli TaxID=2821487 RepID=A0ABS3YVQ0_9BACT|nr:2OG-Fe(II) oxygenase [Niastella soli]MBO9201909.1 2OG-Fe(II) oxygenase [Niastella soli]
MATGLSVQHVLPDSTFTCFVIPSLFSQSECETLLTPAIKNSFQKASSNYPTYYRNNDRFVIDDETLADKLFQKVKSYLPTSIEINNSIQSENGIWELKELNTRLRFCKYAANQYFHRHLDGVHYRSETVQSKLTFMIYLNSATEFKGGRTLFFKTKDTSEIWASYIPKQGDLIVFDHNVWHEGEVLTEGEKYVLRSDILYTRTTLPFQKEHFSGHLGYIWSLLKFDDNTILSGGRDTSIKAWTITGEEKLSLKEHQNSILSLEKINKDTFISGSRDQHIIVWQHFKAIKKIKAHTAIVLSLCRLTDHSFASGGGDNTIQIIDLNGSVLQTLNGHTNWIWQVIKLDKKTIASASEDHTIKIWNIETGQLLTTFTEYTPIISLAFHAPTQQLISGNLHGEISIRTLNENYQQQMLTTFNAHNGIIRTIKLITNNIIATGGEDNKVKLWDFNGNLLTALEHQNFVQAIEQISDNKIISASYDGSIKEWDIKW